MVWYLDKDNQTFKKAINFETGIVESIFQTLRLFKEENPIDCENGIDYLAVFRGEEFLSIQVENVLKRFSHQLKSYQIDEPIKLGEDRLSLRITLFLNNGDIVADELELKGDF